MNTFLFRFYYITYIIFNELYFKDATELINQLCAEHVFAFDAIHQQWYQD